MKGRALESPGSEVEEISPGRNEAVKKINLREGVWLRKDTNNLDSK
jgi:hypothetical protein